MSVTGHLSDVEILRIGIRSRQDLCPLRAVPMEVASHACIWVARMGPATHYIVLKSSNVQIIRNSKAYAAVTKYDPKHNRRVVGME